MKSNDQILLEQAYQQIQEGIFSRLGGMVKGAAAGITQGAQNVVAGAANKVGLKVTSSGKTAGQAYAQAQQKSIFATFINNINKLEKEFEDDIKKMGKVDKLYQLHPEIKQKLTELSKLRMLVKDAAQQAGIKV